MKIAIASFCILMILAGCGGSRTIRVEPAELQDFDTERNVSTAWSTDIGASAKKKAIKLSPVIEGDVIYASDPRGRVSAFDTQRGERKWKVNVKQPITGAVGVGEGLVVVASKKGLVIALDHSNGNQLWTTTVSSEVLAPATVHAGVVVVQTVDGKLAGLSAVNGKRLWLYERTEPPLSLHGTAAPVVQENVVLTGFASGKIVAIQIRDGKPLWELPVTQPQGRNEVERLVDVDVSILIARDVLYAACFQGKVIAVDMRTGRILWSREMSTYSGMDLDSSNLYLTDDRGHVIALDQRTGASVWKQEQLYARQLNAPRYMDGLVAVGDFEGYLHLLSSEDGHFVARHRISYSPIRAQALVSGDLLYVSSQSGALAALRLD